MIMNVTELCVNCKKNNSCTRCWKTSNKKCPYFTKKTNADRIRSMSDEELNCFLHKVTYGMDECPYEYGSEKALEWLQQPAEETER